MYTKGKIIVALLIVGSIILQPLALIAQTVDLVTDPKFDPADIINDDDLTDVASMSVDAVQAFLTSKGGALASYSEPTPPTNEVRTAAQIIWQAGQDARINPEVILVMLQKEQSLIEDPSPSPSQYTWATGYSKCDGCAGVDAYKGFGNQVRAATNRLRYYFDHPQEFTRYGVGKSTTTSDGFIVTPKNQATVGLYIYNPWRGGARVDNRLVGANYNFYKIWTRYFALNFPERTLVKERDSEVWWLIQEGTRRPFIAPEVTTALFEPIARDLAPRLPLRKLLRNYPLGTSVTLDEVYAGIFVRTDLPEHTFGGDIVKGTIQYKNLGTRTWKRGEVVLTLADVAGSPSLLGVQQIYKAQAVVKPKPVKTSKVTKPAAPPVPVMKPTIDPSLVWPDQYGRFSFKSDTVAPGEVASFDITLKFPLKPQGFDQLIALRALPHDDVVVARDVSGTRRSLILVGEPLYQARLVNNTIPTTMKPLETSKVEIEIQNTGKYPWKKMGLRLSSFDQAGKGKNAFRHWSWRDSIKVALMKESVVQPGKSARFSFSIRAPAKLADYTTQYRFTLFDTALKLDNQPLLVNGDPVIVVRTTVEKKTVTSAKTSQSNYQAQLLELSIPDEMRAGESESIQLRLKNTGRTSWKQEQIRLSSFAADGKKTNPFHDTSWRDNTRVVLMREPVVGPGQTGTFIFDITAPNTRGLIKSQYKLTVHDKANGIDGTPIVINDGKEAIVASTTVK